jgi:AAA+ superfamily predicted ATPase
MSKKAIESLDRYIRARYPIIGVVSHEESRVVASVKAVAQVRNRKVVTWSLTQGLKQVALNESDNGFSPVYRFDEEATASEFVALDEILRFKAKSEDDAVLFVMRDLHGLIGNSSRGFDPRLVRYLREIALKFETTLHSMILLSPTLPVPPDLEKTMVTIDWPLPDAEELRDILLRCEADLPNRIAKKLDIASREQLTQAMMGLTAFEAGSVLMSSIAATAELSDACIPFIVKEKAQIIKKDGTLEYYDKSVTMSEVGGLWNLKEYAQIKKSAFSAEARAAGVDAPKGVLLVGVPGTGKSLSAKAIAGGTMPLLRMDVGSLMGGLVGESEQNVRKALKVAEAVAPCVIWMDEIEKAIGGVESSAQSDGGTLARVFGTLLTWMQETTAPVYVVATANDVRALKPEFLRRFDDVVWVDLPHAQARAQILKVHLDKRGHSPDLWTGEEIGAVIDATWGFSGAEIEKVVKAAIEKSFFQKAHLSPLHLLEAAKRIIPISMTMGEKIDELRAWANDRAVMADEPLEPKPVAVATSASRMADL